MPQAPLSGLPPPLWALPPPALGPPRSRLGTAGTGTGQGRPPPTGGALQLRHTTACRGLQAVAWRRRCRRPVCRALSDRRRCPSPSRRAGHPGREPPAPAGPLPAFPLGHLQPPGPPQPPAWGAARWISGAAPLGRRSLLL